MSNISGISLHEIIDPLNDIEKDELYKLLLSDRIRHDVLDRIENNYEDLHKSLEMNKPIFNAFITSIVKKYVYDEKYDNNVSYWVNIDNLINDEMSLIEDTISPNRYTITVKHEKHNFADYVSVCAESKRLCAQKIKHRITDNKYGVSIWM